MEVIDFTDSQTKQCPFCAETIQAPAIKCRYCNEFLNTAKAKSAACPADPADPAEEEKILFMARPSLWGIAGTVTKALIFLAIATFFFRYPIEDLTIFQGYESGRQSWLTEHLLPETFEFILTEPQTRTFTKWRRTAAVGLAALVLLILLIKTINLKAIYYEVTAERIEWARGILDRQVDNLDLFRVVDLRLRRSLLDCIVGIGTVILITTDKTDPEFTFKKIHHSRKLYDIIKDASLAADRRNGVIHIED